MRAGRFAWIRVVFDWLLRICALLLLALMFKRALVSISRFYDVWYYHMPFATRLARIVRPEAFIFYPEDAERFKGFSLLGEAIQGLLWRVSGRAECTNLLAFSCVPLFAWFLARRFSVPPHISVLALLAIPLVHMHSVDSLIDLPASSATAALLLITVRAFASVEPIGIGLLALAATATTIAVNTKLVVGPIVFASVGLLALRLFLVSRSLPEPLKRRYRRMLVGFALLLPIMFATPLKNTILYQNPIYPMHVRILGYQLPGPEAEYASSPVWLENAPRPARFVISILEIKLPSIADGRWNVGQKTRLSHPGFRMGGFFGAYVVLQLGLLGLRLFRERSREVRAAAAGVGIVTLITSVLPQSHELRYHMYWMIFLVGINLWLASRPGAPLFGPLGLGAGAALALGVVLWGTGAAYALPSGQGFSDLVRKQVNAKRVAQIREGETVCVMTEPNNLLWAATFHPPRQYVIQSAQFPNECRGFRRIDAPPARPPRRPKH